jgi:uncharacterized protein YcnI
VRRAFTFAIVAAAILAPSAEGHVTVTPTTAEPGSDQTFVFTVPNETETGIANRFEVILPPGVEAEGAQAKPGWTVKREGGRVVWSGGAIRPGEFEQFGISGSAPKSGASVRFVVRESFANGPTYTYHPTLRLAFAEPARGRDSGARSVARWALAVAVVGLAVAVATFFLVLVLWLRGARSLSES